MSLLAYSSLSQHEKEMCVGAVTSICKGFNVIPFARMWEARDAAGSQIVYHIDQVEHRDDTQG